MCIWCSIRKHDEKGSRTTSPFLVSMKPSSLDCISNDLYGEFQLNPDRSSLAGNRVRSRLSHLFLTKSFRESGYLLRSRDGLNHFESGRLFFFPAHGVVLYSGWSDNARTILRNSKRWMWVHIRSEMMFSNTKTELNLELSEPESHSYVRAARHFVKPGFAI